MRDASGEVHKHGDWLARAADGDHAAFQRFYEETRPLLHRYVAARVDREDVDDLMAESYLRAYRSAGQYEDRGQPAMAWLFTIARNLIASHHRSGFRRRSRSIINTGDQRLAPDVDERLIDRSDDAAVLEALAALKPRHCRILQLRFLDQRTVAECAAELAMTEQAVRALTYRALQAMRNRMTSEIEK